MSKNIIVQVAGGNKQVLDDVYTIAQVKAKLSLSGNYTVSINGEPAQDSDDLNEGDFVSFAQSVKGGSL
jgi:sulfur carrier protein ThiS